MTTSLFKNCNFCLKKIVVPYPSLFKTKKFCSRTCLGKSRKGSCNSHWKGGISNFMGYLMITEGIGGKDYMKFVHRKVMEDHLGRPLKSTEIVHHKNHNKQDNRIENLEIMTRADHVRHHKPRRNYSKIEKFDEEPII